MRKFGLVLTATLLATVLAQPPNAVAGGKSCLELSQPPTDLEIVDNPISKSGPRYPQEALEKNLEGYVKFEVTISPQGDVTNVKVLSAEPPGVFEEATIEAVETWKYCPSGRTITLGLTVNFKLPPGMRIQ